MLGINELTILQNVLGIGLPHDGEIKMLFLILLGMILSVDFIELVFWCLSSRRAIPELVEYVRWNMSFYHLKNTTKSFH